MNISFVVMCLLHLQFISSHSSNDMLCVCSFPASGSTSPGIEMALECELYIFINILTNNPRIVQIRQTESKNTNLISSRFPNTFLCFFAMQHLVSPESTRFWRFWITRIVLLLPHFLLNWRISDEHKYSTFTFTVYVAVATVKL